MGGLWNDSEDSIEVITLYTAYGEMMCPGDQIF